LNKPNFRLFGVEAAMRKDEDDQFAPRPAPALHVIGQLLDELSVQELAERIAALRAEIERLEHARQAKEAGRATAAAFFKSAP
jgi:uncharacterized small protein (DUF1192 family)